MISIDYFSDVLCVWAYGGQIRLDELQREFGDRVRVRQRFMPLFADTHRRIGEGWADRGGFEGFGEHMREVCRQWPHTHPDPGVWNACRPRSCTTAHVFLKAAGLALGVERDAPDRDACAVLDRLTGGVRRAFFEQARDIGDLDVLLGLLDADCPAAGEIEARIRDGAAYAALHRDEQLMKEYGVMGSPTYVFNDGRQVLYGNVGYRIVEANVRELLSAGRIEGAPSWC